MIACPDAITSTDDVKKFFIYLYRVEKLCFHPDDPFDDYIDFFTKEKTFSDEQCKRYDDLMRQSFDVCNKVDADFIYEIGMQLCEEHFS
jgi:hypothetical protein